MRAIGIFGWVLAAGCASSASGETSDMRPIPTLTGPQAPVVIELFTSQGCSSCPPADAVVSRLVAAGTSGTRQVVPLAFHVDYWNDLGWADPFSSAAWTKRQYEYATSFSSGRVYTPQMIVTGQTDVLGSNGLAVGDAIAHAPAQAPLTATATWAAGQVSVAATAPADADVWVAVWEDGLKTEVTRGENSGETLPNDHVVRRLVHVAAAGQTGTARVALEPGWRRVGAVAFAQRGADHRIVGSALLPRS